MFELTVWPALRVVQIAPGFAARAGEIARAHRAAMPRRWMDLIFIVLSKERIRGDFMVRSAA